MLLDCGVRTLHDSIFTAEDNFISIVTRKSPLLILGVRTIR